MWHREPPLLGVRIISHGAGRGADARALGRHGVALLLVALERVADGGVGLVRPPRGAEHLGEVEQRVRLPVQLVRRRHEPNRLAGERLGLLRPRRSRASSFARTPRQITCVDESSAGAVVSLTVQKRAASS